VTTTSAGNPPRNRQGRLVRQLSTVERDAEAATLAAKGVPYSEIAATLGYADKGGAWRGARRALSELGSMRSLDQVRGELLLELSELRRHSWEVIANPPPSFDRVGRVQRDDAGEVVPDAMVVAEEKKNVMRAEALLMRLTGAAAPKRPVAAQMTPEQRMELMQELVLISGASPDDVYGGSLIAGHAEP
jgi:hypothetical protein